MPKHLVICDLDNTLYDWVNFFVPAFYAMVDKVVEISGWNREELLDDFREVHQRHQDSEHPFALLETRHVRERYRGVETKELMHVFDSAFHAFNSERKRSLHLFPGVIETLRILQGRGICIAAHTEAKLYSVADRLMRLNLVPYFDMIYCRERSPGGHPLARSDWISQELSQKVKELSHHQRKPDVDVLLEICGTFGVIPEHAAYIGDSVSRDVMMAKHAGVFAIWAAYGTNRNALLYEKLVRVTHWSPEDVEREKAIAAEAKKIKPDFTAKEGFIELLNAIPF